jgi:hypothetical protein
MIYDISYYYIIFPGIQEFAPRPCILYFLGPKESIGENPARIGCMDVVK